MAVNGRHPAAGGENARQVQRVRRRNRDPVIRWGIPPAFAEHRHRACERELLAAQGTDESPAANLSACLQTPEDAQQIAPTRQAALPLQDAAAHDSVAAQNGPCRMLDRFPEGFAGDVPGHRCQQCPTAGRIETRPSPAAPAVKPLAAARRCDEHTQPLEGIGGDQSAGHQFCQCFLGLNPQQSAGLNEFLEEQRALVHQQTANSLRPRRQGRFPDSAIG